MGNRCKGLIEVDAVEIGEALGHKACMLLEDLSAGVTFNAEYPSATYNVHILHLINLIPDFILDH